MAATGKEAVTLEQFKLFAESQGGGGFDIDKVYPVGSVYFSMSSVNPSSLFGGTWQKIEGRFILTSDSSRQAGDTGGSNDAVVISHTHSGSTNSAGSHDHSGSALSSGSHTHSISGGSHTHSASTTSAGGHTHTPTNADSSSWLATKPTKQPSCTYTTNHEWAIPYWYTTQTSMGTAGSHSHTVSVSTSSSHSHTISSAGAHTHTLDIDSDGSHSHNVSINSAGVSGTDKNMPAYFVINAWQRIA